MNTLPVKARVFIAFLFALAMGLFGLSLVRVRELAVRPLDLFLLTGAIVLADVYPIHLPFESRVEATVSCAVKTAALILLGPWVTVLITLVGTLTAEVILRRAWYKAVFNTSEMIITTALMALTYDLFIDGVARNPFHSVQNSAALGGMLLVYLAINMGLVAAMVSLATGLSFWHILRSNSRDMFWTHLTVVPLGGVMAAMWEYRIWAVLGLVMPIILVRQSYQFIAELHQQTRDALVGMADAIDQRDPSTFQHSQRVSTISEVLARQMGLPLELVESVRMAARLHDLGKIGMGNALLYKPGKFNDKEIQEFRKHPTIGAEMVKSFRSFTEGQTLILHHHERYDGQGYPASLAGEDIPLGSRILAVADSVDAMTSRRVYRTPLTLDEAVAELFRNRGTQFDPLVVDAFAEALERSPDRMPWSREEIVSCTASVGKLRLTLALGEKTA
jgi:putative nucleotidyltransferase with HDIG domain